MKWRVRGANLETGDDATIEIEATHAHIAESKARLQGLAVSSVEPIQPPTIEYARPIGETPAPSEKAAERYLAAQKRAAFGESWTCLFTRILSLACHLLGWGMLISGFMPEAFHSSDTAADRLAEVISRDSTQLTGAVLICVGILFQIIAHLIIMSANLRLRNLRE